MDPITLYPSKKYPRALKVSVFLLLLLSLMTWSIPLVIAAGYGLGSWVLGAVAAVILHVLVVWGSFWLVDKYCRTLRYEILPDEIIVHAGIVTKSVKHVPFRTVTNIKVTRGPIERTFGLGSLAVQTAGLSGTTGAEENLTGLDDVQAVYEQIATRLRRFRSALSPTQAEDEDAAEVDLLTQIRDDLRALRADLRKD